MSLGYKGKLTKQPYQMTATDYWGRSVTKGKTYEDMLKEITPDYNKEIDDNDYYKSYTKRIPAGQDVRSP